MTPLKVQTGWFWDAEFVGYFAAAELGFYESLGLEVTFLEGGPTVNPEEVLIRGEADIAISVPDSLAAAIVRRHDLVAIGRQYARDPLAVIVSAESTRTHVSDLRGAALFVPDVSRDRLRSALTAHGVPLADVGLFPLGSGRPRLSANMNIGIVGYSTWLPSELVAQGEGNVRILPLDSAQAPMVQNVLSVTRETLATKRVALTRFLRASSDAWLLNGEDVSIYPRAFRETWYRNLDRSVADEVAHNAAQLDFLAEEFTLDDKALKSLEAIGESHDLHGRSWMEVI